jgi:hypothetical protein
MAMNLGVSGKAEADSVLRLVNVGNTYTFYLDPSVPLVNGITYGLNRINYNSKRVHVKSRLFEIIIGVLFALTGLVVTILVALKKGKKRKLT